jgi:WhiB family transcriptional regulator, redox-sensing transcriptional regulator
MTWRNRATCLGEDPELFFPIGNTGPALVQIEEARAICRRCEVVDTCLRWAMESGADTGVWGGLSDDERRSLKRRRARARVLSLVVGGQGRQRDFPDMDQTTRPSSTRPSAPTGISLGHEPGLSLCSSADCDMISG